MSLRKKKFIIFGLSCFLPTCVFPVVTCSSCHRNDDIKTKNDKFLGFKDDKLTYTHHFTGEEIDVPIINKSSTYYTLAEPLEFCVTKTPQFSFTIITKDESVSKRMRFFHDESTPNHPISIITKSFVDKIPDMTVLNDKVRRDSIYVNFECNEDILFEIPYRVWRSNDSELTLIYHKTSPNDRHTVSASPDNGYIGTLLCNKNGYEEDSTSKMTIICKPAFGEYINYDLDTYVYTTGLAEKFIPAINYSITYDKFDVNDSLYYCIYISYTFLAHITPSYDQCQGDSGYIFKLNIVDPHDKESIKKFCNFRITWV